MGCLQLKTLPSVGLQPGPYQASSRDSYPAALRGLENLGKPGDCSPLEQDDEVKVRKRQDPEILAAQSSHALHLKFKMLNGWFPQQAKAEVVLKLFLHKSEGMILKIFRENFCCTPQPWFCAAGLVSPTTSADVPCGRTCQTTGAGEEVLPPVYSRVVGKIHSIDPIDPINWKFAMSTALSTS